MSGSTIPDDISALLSSPIEHFINTNVAILEGDKFADQALNLMKERDVRSVLASRRRSSGYCEQDGYSLQGNVAGKKSGQS